MIKKVLRISVFTGMLTGVFLSMHSCRTVLPVYFYIPPGTSREVYRNSPDLLVTVYPHKFSRPAGSVIFIHGGGWQMGGPDMPFYSDWEELLYNARLKVFSIEHRTSPSYRGRELVYDCMDAVRYINKNAARFGIPENRFALVGFSSGGHLALMSALEFNEDSMERIKISSVIAYYPPVELKLLYRNGNSQVRKILEEFVPVSSLADERSLFNALEELSPYSKIHKKMPHTLLVHGKADRLVPWNQSKIFYEKSRMMNPDRIELILIHHGRHNFNSERNRESIHAEKRAVKFIQKYMN